MPSAWKTIRVFISSTFRDMQAERDWLVRFVFPKLREELLKHRIHLIDVDLRWGVTSDQDALGVCREVIDECHPRFMGMLGGRYGWVPEGQEKSITADEIHYGVLKREAEDRGRAFFFFRDPKATAETIEESAGEYREPAGSDAAGKLTALKQAITDAKLPVFIYPAHWDATQQRLTGLETFGNRVFSDLLQSCKDDPKLAGNFTEQSTAPPDEFTEEAEQMEAFIEERTERFVIGSREPLLREMLAFAAAEGTPNIFVLIGDPGSGKSALLAKFTRDLSALHPSSFILPTFVGASTGSTDLRRTLRRLCHDIAPAAGNTEPLPLDIKDLVTHFPKLLAEAAAKKRVILIFDALNQFDATDGAHWLNWLPRELPPGVRIVASVIAPADGQPEHQTLAILRTRPGNRLEKLEPLTEADALAIIESSLRRYAKRLSPEQLAALLAKPAGRLPLYVLTALEELRTLGTYEEITERIRTLPGDARALFGWILTERLARDPGFRDREGRPCGAALVEKFAACLGVSRHGLSPAELAALLDPGDPLGNVAALLRLLRPYLMRRGELLDFYHGQFREAAEVAYLKTPENQPDLEKQRSAHQSIANCLQAFADPHRDGQCRDATAHALSELPHHQTRAEAWPDLIATLENIFFLEAKVTHGMTFDLAADFTAAVDALPAEHVERQRLRLLFEALRRDIHFIARRHRDYPQGLFQCLWNSGWWFDCPQAAEHYELVEPKPNAEPPPWEQPGPKLCFLLQAWRVEKEQVEPGLVWLRALRPPAVHLGTPQKAVFRGHQGASSTVAYSPDGRRIVIGTSDNMVREWDAATGQELLCLHGHKDIVTSVAYSPDGRRILTGSGDNTVRVWDAVTGQELCCLRGHEDWVRSVAYSPDGRRILSGSGDMTVREWDAATGQELRCLHGHEGVVSSVKYSSNGRWIASGSWDKTARVWDAVTGVELCCLRGHEGTVNSVACSSDGQRLFSGSNDKTVREWDAESGQELRCLHGHEDIVTSVACSPDGRRVVSGSLDKSVREWDAASGQELCCLRGHEGWVMCVAYSPNGRRILSGSDEGSVREWEPLAGQQLRRLRGHETTVCGVAYSPDGRRIVSGSGDLESPRTVWEWDAVTGQELRCLRGPNGMVTGVAYSPDGRWILSRWGGALDWRWNAETGEGMEVPSERIGVEEMAPRLSQFSFQILSNSTETIIKTTADDQAIAWFATRLPDSQSSRARLMGIATHPSGRQWVSVMSNTHVQIVQLEGGPKAGGVLMYPFQHNTRHVVNPTAEQIGGALRNFSSTGGSLLGVILLKRRDDSKNLLFYVHRDIEAVIARTCGDFGRQVLIGDSNREGELIVCDQAGLEFTWLNRHLVPLSEAIDFSQRFVANGYYGEDLVWEDMPNYYF